MSNGYSRVAKGWVAALCVSSAMASVAFGQGATGRIEARLVDPNGAQIVNVDANVYVKNAATGEMKSMPLPKEGVFTIAGLAPGVYDLTIPIQSAMYAAYEQKTIRIAAGEVVKADLNVGWSGNLGTIGDDPTMLGADMRKRAGDVSGPTPRMADGKPDFNGMWYVIPQDRGARPPIPMQKWAEDMNKELQRINQQGAHVYCLPQSATPITLPFPHKFVQTKDVLVHITEFTTPGYRQIFLDGRPHPPAEEWNPSWMGHSVGHWEGGTLVVDTIGFRDQVYVAMADSGHSDRMHIVERIRMVEPDVLEVAMVITDDVAFEAPSTRTLRLKRRQGMEIQEYVCAENNRNTPDESGTTTVILSGDR